MTSAQDTGVPVVMSFAGSDPTGGAGIQADIEAVASMGCHAAPVITAVTVQDTTNVLGCMPLAAELVVQQARAVLEDMPVQAIKLGLLGSVEIIEAVHSILVDYPQVPVVMDPVLAAGGGAELSDEAMIDAMRALLLGQVTLLTPNSPEARRLAPEADTLDACAMALLDQGCEYILITGGHEQGSDVINTLYSGRRRLERFSWPRLPGSYHGSGCTLAAATAGLIAQAREPLTAIYEAQEFTWQSLRHGYRVGMGQHLPDRLFWAQDDDPENG
jgi:hydroxymethylpyrimidine/phosphomethylpyrimidine kinase